MQESVKSYQQNTKMKVLVVDDDLRVREMITRMLSPLGYECKSAANGKDALDFLQKDNFTIVISDIRMPGIDGIELLKKMKQSGCYAMNLAIESGSEKIQKDMKKNLNLKKVEEVVNIANKLGIISQGFFILGYPTESREDILKTIKLSKKLNLSRAFFFLFQPLLGSEIYETLKKGGKLPHNFSPIDADYSMLSILPEKIGSNKELERLRKQAILGFYLRPRVFF